MSGARHLDVDARACAWAGRVLRDASPSSAKILGFVLAYRATPSLSVSVTPAELAEECRMATRTVRRALASLEGGGWLRRHGTAWLLSFPDGPVNLYCAWLNHYGREMGQ